jgi:hypothetical protein
LSVRVTPASRNEKPVLAPPSPPAEVTFSTSIWAAICASVKLPVAPSVTTWKYTGTDALNVGPAEVLDVAAW